MTARFAIDAQAVGGRIVVNGEDLSNQVVAAELRLAPTSPTALTLHMVPVAGLIEGEGIVQIAAEQPDDAEVICAFLAAVDPTQLEQDALMNPGPSGTLTATMLQVMAGYARGVAP